MFWRHVAFNCAAAKVVKPRSTKISAMQRMIAWSWRLDKLIVLRALTSNAEIVIVDELDECIVDNV